MDALVQDLRFAARTLRRAPGFALVAVLTLALGIGANTALFSMVSAVLLRPLPFDRPERLVTPSETLLRAELVTIRDGARSFESFAGYQAGSFSLSGEGEPVRVAGAHASAGFFSTLGVRPLLGRAFVPGDDQPGAEAVAVLGHALWRDRFGGDRAVIGRKVLLDGAERTIVGVMSAAFRFPANETSLWVPMELDPAQVGAFWGSGGVQPVGRLRPGVSVEQAQSELRSFGPALRRANPLWTPDADYRATLELIPLRERMVGGVRTTLLVLQGAVAFVLLIACANLGNVLLARGLARERELALRAALGAGRGRVVRQLLTESVVLALAGAAVGVGLAVAGLRLLVAALPAETPRLAAVAIDGPVLGFALATAVVAGLGFGVIPAWRASRLSLQDALRRGGRGGRDPRTRRLSGALVGAEIALAVVLVSGAGLLVRSFWQMSRVEPGFRTDGVVSARVSPPERMYAEPARQRAFHQEVLGRVQALPGVSGVAAASQLPLDGSSPGWAVFVDGVHTDPRATLPMLDRRSVTSSFFQVMGIPLLRGRGFDTGDGEGAPAVVIVDERAANEFWPGQDPIGKRISHPWMNRKMTVVGVVGSVRSNTLFDEPSAAMYIPFAQSPAVEMTLVVRTAMAPGSLAGALRGTLAQVDPAVPVSHIRTPGEMVAGSVAGPRLTAVLLAGLALVALLLGGVGIYGVIANTVGQRKHEIGVRMALGARRGQVVGMVLRQGVALTAAGLVVGIPAGLAAARLLRGLLYGVTAADPLTFAAVPVLLAATALLAAWLPARRAARIDPMVSLRGD